MSTILRYYITGSFADLLDLRTPGAEYTLAEQQLIANGSGGVNTIWAAAGVDLDARNLFGGTDVVLFNYNWDQYTKDISTVPGAIVFSYTDSTSGLTEKVTVANGATTLGRDQLIFADGAVGTQQANAALQGSLTAALNTVSGANNSITSAAYSPTAPAGNTLRAFASTTSTTTGATFAMTEAGQSTVVTGTGQSDKVYVKAGATVDARNLLGGEDQIYLTGNWADYTKSLTEVSGAITFTRSVNGGTEKVTVANGATAVGRDKLVFADGAVLTHNARTALTADLNAALSAIIGFDTATQTPFLEQTLNGGVTAGTAVEGITITAFDAEGNVVATTTTDANGQYELVLGSQYAGQALLLKASDGTADGVGYVDEATGESKDFTVNLRAMVQVGTGGSQKAQISTATELATRILNIGDDNKLLGSEADRASANQAVADFLGLSNIVDADNPQVVGKDSASDAYGKGLALLSGMDAVAERSGSSNATNDVLDQLVQAFTLVGGSVQTQFNDPELLNLLSQAVTEVVQTQGADLAQDLAGVALRAVQLVDGSEEAPLAFFLTSSRNVIGDGKTATLTLRFETEPTAEQVAGVQSALQVSGGSLSELTPDSSDPTGTTYTAVFTQVGTETPHISVSGNHFANDLSMVLDNSAPTLTISRLQGLDSEGLAKTTLRAGDTVRVMLSASEAVTVADGATVQLQIGSSTVNAQYNSQRSGSRTLVFDYTVGQQLTDTQGVSVLGVTAIVTDLAGNAADLGLSAYNGLPLYVDTTAPVVLAQIPVDNSTVGNAGVQSLTLSFGETVSKGTSGTLVLKNAAGQAVASWQAQQGVLSADGLTVSYALPDSLAPLPAGQYTIEATGSPLTDLAGNALATNALAADGSWSFTVGAVSIGIDKVGGDNLLNNEDVLASLTLSGTVSGEGSEGVTAADMQVWLQPLGDGTAVQAQVQSLSNGQWSASVAEGDALALQGGYVVRVMIDANDVQASASSALVVDRHAQVALGQVAGDNLISLVEQSVIQTGKNLNYSFVAEKGSSGTITFQKEGGSPQVVKTFSNAKGTAPDQVTLSKGDLASLGTGSFSVVAAVTDVAGNTASVSRAFTIEAAAPAAQIVGINLHGSRSGSLIQGDTLSAVVQFDKAITVSNADALTLNLQVGDATRQARFAGLSAERKQILFSYTVLAGDTDSDGVALNANALQLGVGNAAASIKDVALGSAATLTSSAVNAQGNLKVDGSATNVPADLALTVTEAGLTATHQPSAGKAVASGKLLGGVDISAGKSIAKVQFGEGEEILVTTEGVVVEGIYGSWIVKADGSYTYALSNSRPAVQALTAGQSSVDTLKFWDNLATEAATATVTVRGSNDAPTVGAAWVSAANQGGNVYTLNLLQGASDPDAGEALSLQVSAITYKLGSGPLGTGLPDGLSLGNDGKTLTVDPGHEAYHGLAAGAKQDLVLSYRVTDAQGASVAQRVTITLTGTNDAPTVSAALAVDATEGAGLAALHLLKNANDVDADNLRVQGLSFTVGGEPTGNTGQDLPAGMGLGSDLVLRLDPRHPAYNTLKVGETLSIVASYTVLDGQGGTVAQTATFSLTGTNDAPRVNAAKAVIGQTVMAGGSFSYTFDAQAFVDVEGEALSYSASLADGVALPSWLQFNAESRTFSGTAPASATASQLNIRITATDGTADTALSASQGFTLAISPAAAPVAKVDLAQVLESGIDTNGQEQGQTTAADNVLNNDTASTALTVTGARSHASADTSVSMIPVPAGSSSAQNALTLQGLYGTLQIGADGSYSYSLDAARSNGLKAGQVVNDIFSYQVSDNAGQTASSQLLVQVTGSNDAPVASVAQTTLSLAQGQAFAYTMPATLFADPDRDGLSLSAAQVQEGTTAALPDWLQWDAVTRSLRGTPPETASGTLTVRVSASDGQGGIAHSDVVLQLAKPAAPVAVADVNTVTEAGLSSHGAVVGKAQALGNVLGNDSRSASSFRVSSADVGATLGAQAQPIDTVVEDSPGSVLLTGAYGSLTLYADGYYAYQLSNQASSVQALKVGEQRDDVFTYELTDSAGQKARAQLTVKVQGSNDAPTVAAALVSAANEGDSAYTIDLLQGASDVDDSALSVSGLTYKVGNGAVSSTLSAGLSLGADGKTLTVNPSHAAFGDLAEGATRQVLVNYLVKDAQGASVAQKATITLTGTSFDAAPTSSAVASEAPRAYDQGALSGPTADNFMLRFSEVVNADLLQDAMAQGKVSLLGANGVSRSLGAGAVLEAYTPSSIVVTGLSEAANGSYTSLWSTATNSNTVVPTFANGFGLAKPDSFSVNNSTTIYKKTNTDGSVWYIWQQTGWRTWIISQDNPLDAQGNAREWFISTATNSTDPTVRTAVLGVSGWSAKTGALQEGVDPWAGTSRIAAADLEPNGWGRTFVLALGAGNTAQAGDTLVIDKVFVKDTANKLATSDVTFALPADITRPTALSSSPAVVQGIGSDGSVKTTALVAGDIVRVTITMNEAVTVSSNTTPSLTLELDASTRQAGINRGLSFANGATSSNKLVFDYVVQTGDSDVLGGITVGAYNRNNSNVFDLSGNRFSAPSNVVETSNTVSIGADTTAPTIASVYNSDKAVVSGTVGDTFNFRFAEIVNVDHLETAFANGQIKVTSADGTVVRNLGAGAQVEATYPSTITVSGFSTAADGAYTTLWSPAYNKNMGAPVFSGFSTSGVALSADVNNYPVYKHIDSAGQGWYLWRPVGWSNYVLTPESSSVNGTAQSWWASGSGGGTGTSSVPREGVVLGGEWYANSGQLSNSQSMWTSSNKLSVQPSLEATGWAYTFTLALGSGHEVQQGDQIVIGAGAAKDANGNSNSSDITSLPADITRPVLGTAVVKGYKNTWDTQTQSSTYAETTDSLVQHDLIRVGIPVSENLKLYHSGGYVGHVALDIGGQTRYATLNLQLSSSTGTVTWGFSSNKLVYEYWIQSGDVDTAGGITVGAMNRGNVGLYDAASNRPWVPSDVPEEANTITVVDNTPPSILNSVYSSASTVVLTLSEALDAAHLPPASAFAVTVNGQSVEVKSVAVAAGSNSVLVLTLASAAASGTFVQVSYTDPTTDNDTLALQDLSGNDVQSNSYQATAIAAPSVQYVHTGFDKIEIAGESELRFMLKFSDLVKVAGTPRLVLSVSDGSTSQTVYANFEPYTDANHGQTGVEFVYRPAAGVQGQVHVSAFDANGGSITAYNSAGTVDANITLNDSTVFSPYTWVYAQGLDSTAGDSANNLLTPWFDAPQNTPRALSASSANGGAGNRDALAVSVLLPGSVTSSSAAAAYSLSYNVTTEGVRQVLLKNGSTVVDTYTVPSDAHWPMGVEQLIYHAVYKDSAGQVQFAGLDNVLLTLGQHEYIDPVNPNQRWVQGSLNSDVIDVSGRDAAQFIFIEGEQGNDTITGHDGVDIIRGGGGTNLINAGKGDDHVVIRRGTDSTDGGEGIDTLRFDLPGQEKKITVDDAGLIHVYSAYGSWDYGFTPDANGWVERYRLSTDFGTDGSNRIAVYDVALGRNVAQAKNMERLQWRLDENSSGRSTNTFKVGTSGDDTINAVADVVLAGAGNDTITLSSGWLHTNDWRNGDRALLIDGGAGRDVLQLTTFVSGQLSQAFEWNSGSNVNASRVLKNIEGLGLAQGSYLELSAQDIHNLYASGSNTSAWGEVISGLDASQRQFLVSGLGSLSLSDSSGWTAKAATVSYNNQSHKVFQHSSGVQLLVDSNVWVSGLGIVNENSNSLLISSDTFNGEVSEGNSGITPVTFTVTRTGNSASELLGTWLLSHYGTSSADFADGQMTSGTVSFATGQTSQTIVINVKGDTDWENNERFGVSVSYPGEGTSLGFTQTEVTVRDDDGFVMGDGPAPVVTLVRAETPTFVTPGDTLKFVVELDQVVTVQGTPRLALVLTDPTGAQPPRTVYADFVPYSDSINGTWNQQSSVEFAYTYGSADAVGAGWMYRISGLENVNGSSIKSVESASYNQSANLTLNRVAITAGTWLYTSFTGVTGTANNDMMEVFDAASTVVPKTLSSTSANGGAGDRDVMGVPVLLPSSVTTAVQARNYYLNYEVSTDSNGAATGRYVKLYQSGNSTAVDTYTLPLNGSGWPNGVEALGYFLQFKDANDQIQEADHPGDHLIFWKATSSATDSVNGDVAYQGSYLSDTINLAAVSPTIPTASRVLVRGNQGNDNITGHDGIDVIHGDGGNDTVNAGAGNDLVFLSTGVDTLDGGTGTDTLAWFVKGQEAMPAFTADGKLQVMSAFGVWSNDNFTPDSNGFQLDWTFDINGQTGDILTQRAGSSEVSTAKNFEKMRVYSDLYQVVRGDTTGEFDILLGTSGNDVLDTTDSQGILHGLDGNDTIRMVTASTPVVMGGLGDDVVVLMAAVFGLDGNGDIMVHGGAGTDTLKVGADLNGATLYQPGADSGTLLQSFEVLDITGSTEASSAGNTLRFSAAWMRDLTDAGSSRSFAIVGDSQDSVSLLQADNWQQQASSDRSGFALYATTLDSVAYQLYLGNTLTQVNASAVF
ncbi:VCBS domain-containing protein [Limnohabitans lacus]|uniref:VCBS domain-containing protein n=1 Tax=Limnohabitans lacus TaxID=3045173 RepID=A0ABT6XAU2_9BURK|nr:VCBS domain-containing protein [Limnohabitans sp. HM2-2]MDI9235251.1 VCBS domain-containing protein [Limnohabitans sp. HM2-2]